MAVVAKSRARVVAIATPEDIRVAVGAVAHVAPAARPAVRAMLQRRAAQVGGAEHIPAHWHSSGQIRQLSTVMAVQLAEAAGVTLDLANSPDLELAAQWKHGWIPVNAAAREIAAARKRAGLPVGGEAPRPSKGAYVAPSKHGGFNVVHKGKLVANHTKQKDAEAHQDRLNAGSKTVAHVRPSAHGGHNVIHRGKLVANHPTDRKAREHADRLNLADDCGLTLDLAGKWKHGWIPLDAVAALVKAKKYHGGPGGDGGSPGKIPTGKNRRLGKGRAGEAVMASRGLMGGRVKGASGPRGVAPKAAGGVSRGYHPSDPQPDLRSASMSDLQHERDHPFEARRAAAREEIRRRGDSSSSARLQVRVAAYRGESGHHVTGRDAQGRKVAVFVPGDQVAADRAASNIRAGRPAFSAAPSAEHLPAAREAVRLKGSELRSRAAGGDKIAQAELARRDALPQNSFGFPVEPSSDPAGDARRAADPNYQASVARFRAELAATPLPRANVVRGRSAAAPADALEQASTPAVRVSAVGVARAKGSDLRRMADSGDKAARAELDRRAAGRAGKATAAAQQVAQDRHHTVEAKRVGREEAAGVRSWTDEELHSAISAHGSDTQLGTRAHAELERRGKPAPFVVPRGKGGKDTVLPHEGQSVAPQADVTKVRTADLLTPAEPNHRAAEHNQLAAFLAGGLGTKAGREFAKASERDQRRRDPVHQQRLADAKRRREERAVKRNEDAAREWAAGESRDALEQRVARGPRVVNGRDYLYEAARAALGGGGSAKDNPARGRLDTASDRAGAAAGHLADNARRSAEIRAGAGDRDPSFASHSVPSLKRMAEGQMGEISVKAAAELRARGYSRTGNSLNGKWSRG